MHNNGIFRSVIRRHQLLLAQSLKARATSRRVHLQGSSQLDLSCADGPKKDTFNVYLSHLYHWIATTEQYGCARCLHAA